MLLGRQRRDHAPERRGKPGEEEAVQIGRVAEKEHHAREESAGGAAVAHGDVEAQRDAGHPRHAEARRTAARQRFPAVGYGQCRKHRGEGNKGRNGISPSQGEKEQRADEDAGELRGVPGAGGAERTLQRGVEERERHIVGIGRPRILAEVELPGVGEGRNLAACHLGDELEVVEELQMVAGRKRDAAAGVRGRNARRARNVGRGMARDRPEARDVQRRRGNRRGNAGPATPPSHGGLFQARPVHAAIMADSLP